MDDAIKMYEMAYKLSVKEANRYVLDLVYTKPRPSVEETVSRVTRFMNKRIKYHMENMVKLYKLKGKVRT